MARLGATACHVAHADLFPSFQHVNNITRFSKDAQLVKLYGESPEAEKRYSPAVCIGAHKNPIEGNPDPKYISTSFAERQNLNVRMHTRRFTRLTNAFSKKVENHAHSVALFAMYYNFVRIHKTLRTTARDGRQRDQAPLGNW
jgi:hypothetical protein